MARRARRALRTLGSLETPDGLVTFPLHAALIERLKLVRTGADVLIRYAGKQISKAGRTFKAFDVFVAGEDALMDVGDLPTPLRLDREV